MGAKIQAKLDEIVSKMNALKGGETDHIEADDLLCEALKLLGQNELVEAFNKIGKWYA